MAATKVHDETEEAAAGPGTGTNGTEHTSSSLLTFEDILAADDTRFETVEVPEWGGRVRVASLTGEQRGVVFAAIRAHGKQIKDEDEAQSIFYARVIAASLVDETGKHVGKQSMALSLTKKNAAALNRIYRVCSRLSGIGEDDEEQAKNDLKATPSSEDGSD